MMYTKALLDERNKSNINWQNTIETKKERKRSMIQTRDHKDKLTSCIWPIISIVCQLYM